MSQMTWSHLYDPLLELGKYRYKVYHSGRGAGKSEHFARALLKLASEYTMTILCVREVQNSITDSVHRLLSDIIRNHDLEDSEFTIQKTTIINNHTGSQFIFKGLKKETQSSLKSTANVDICWVEEASTVSQSSWDILIPTIRNEGSEIWISFNPEYEDDPVYELFVENPPDNAYVKKVGWEDNDYIPQVLIDEKDLLYKTNPKRARWIWGGECKTDFDANVYRWDESTNCVEHQIVYNPSAETWASFDFGVSDGTAIIFAQIIKVPKSDEYPLGFQINIFDEVYETDKGYEYYRDVVDGKGYNIKMYACDPSGKNRDSSLSSWIDSLAKNPATGERDWHFIYDDYYAGKTAEMIEQTNTYMHAIRYNKKQCPTMHQMFRRWKYRTDRNGTIVIPPKPNHDEHSHIGTALYFFIINRFPIKKGEIYLP